MIFINNKLTLALSLVTALAACSPSKTANEYLAEAKTHIENSKHEDALIELKNAVRLDLNNGEARLLLGSLYLKVGNWEGAEKELTRALDLNEKTDVILPKLLQSLNLQNKNEEILKIINSNDNFEISPEILLYKALAYQRLDDNERARVAIEKANEISTESVYSQLGNAYLKADSTSIDDALAIVENVLQEAPELTEALILKGQLAFTKNDYPTAIEAFLAYQKLLPNDLKIKLFIANAYVKNEEFSKAEPYLDTLLEFSPEHPFSNQLKGLIAYESNDYDSALAHTEKAIQNGLDTPPNRVVAGLSAFKLEQYERSHQYLNTLSDVLAPTHPVRRVLAFVQMQLGYSADAGDTLENFEGLTAQDVGLFTTASFELLKAGKIEEAKKLLSKTDGITSDSSVEMTKMGILKLSMNDLEGLADLQKAIEIDPDLPMAKIALAAAYIETKEYDKALVLAEKWKGEQPDKVEGYNLKAKILFIQNKTEQAEEELNNALTINANNTYSRLYFASKELANKQPAEAIKHLENIFSVFPNHLKALEFNYSAHKALSSESSAIDKIVTSFNENENNLAYRLLNAKVHFVEQDFNKVISLLENTSNASNTPAVRWVLLGDSYINLQQNDKALAVYSDWIKSQPQNRAAWLRKVATQEKLVDYNGALSTVEKALKIAPDDNQLSVLRANYLILTKAFDKAQTQIDSLTAEQKELPLVQGLQAKIWLTEGKFKQALKGLQSLYDLQPGTFNAALLFTTYRKLEQEKVAFDFIQTHVEAHPQDNISRNLLAESAINFDKSLSKKHYQALLVKAPDNISVLNNLAWVEYLLANYSEADKLAKRAMKLNSSHPQVLDTAGLIQLKLGNKAQAIELLKQANALAPDDAEIAKHYQEAINQ